MACSQRWPDASEHTTGSLGTSRRASCSPTCCVVDRIGLTARPLDEDAGRGKPHISDGSTEVAPGHRRRESIRRDS